jgi:hypothetical protein
MVARASREPLGENKWMGLDDVLVALQVTMRRADERLSNVKSGFQYVVTEVGVSFPAEMRVQTDRIMVRLLREVGEELPKIPEGYLSRLTFSLKPVPSIKEEPQTSPKPP